MIFGIIYSMNWRKKDTKNFLVISVLFYDRQIFFKPYGKWFANQLKKKCRLVLSSNGKFEKLAQKINLKQSSRVWRYTLG